MKGDQRELFEPTGGVVWHLLVGHLAKADALRAKAAKCKTFGLDVSARELMREAEAHDLEAAELEMLAMLEALGGVRS